MVYDVVAGTTSPLQFQLVEHGQPIDLTNLTVTLLLNDHAGVAVPNPGPITIVDTVNGVVQLAPTNAGVFVASSGPYYARWQLATSGGLVSFVPSTSRDLWNINGV